MTSLNLVLRNDRNLRLLNETSVRALLTQLVESAESSQAELKGIFAQLTLLEQDLARNAALSGSMIQSSPSAEDVSAAALNAATPGTFRLEFGVDLTSLNGVLFHTWCSLVPLLTPLYAGGGTAANPTFEGSPSYSDGHLSVGVVFDSGTPGMYLVGDTVTVDVQVQASNLLLGWPVAMVTKTYNVIA